MTGKIDVVKKNLKLLGDIIGIKIITELKTDCNKVYQLMMNNNPLLEKKHLKFSDIADQPVSMKNGLSIYNIKGMYQNECNFELQIKSKIDSAWGDLDHTLFYKDYKISPIKTTVQVSMNRIGMLLNELEHFLHDIRESDKEYNERSNFISQCDLLQRKLSEKIKEKLKVDYDLTDISPQLIHICKKLGIVIDENLPVINFKALEIDFDEASFKHYTKIRNSDYKLMILESAFMSWYFHLKNEEINVGDYKVALSRYVQVLNEYLVDQILHANPNFDEEKVNTHVTACTIDNVKYIISPKVFLSVGCHVDVIKQNNCLNDCLDDEKYKEELKIILSANSIQAFGGDFKTYVSGCNNWEFDILEPTKLKSCLNDIKNNDSYDKKFVAKVEHGINNILIHVKQGD